MSTAKNTAPNQPANAPASETLEEGAGVIKLDPWLAPYKPDLLERYAAYKKWKQAIDEQGGYEKFTRGYERFGFQISDKGITYREWAPNATKAFLFGDFNQWNPTSHPMKKDDFGVYEIFLPNNADGTLPIAHNSKIKITMIKPDGTRIDRLPAWIHRVTQDLS
ncbi:immunoglobulin E-set, partial [Gamsiella multidivaricata]|uniref:immunoglobulin E-set n=1 Tax=Gamsiella multidivaricata TaxID=101098 RepID=UPI00221FC09D